MNVRMPDGTVIENVPDGTTRAELVARLQRNGYQVPKEWAQATDSKLAPEDTPSVGQTLLIGAGRTFDRVGKGMQQIYYGATGNTDAQAKLKAQAEADDAQYSKLREARPWATGIGESLPTLVLPGGGSATLLGNAGRMALAGAAPGLLEYGSAGERLQRGAIGAAGGAAVPLLGAAAKTAWSAIEPLTSAGRDAIAGRLLNRLAGAEAPAVRARLASATELVPGSAPTAAQVAQSGGISALERAMSQANPEAYTQRAMQQAAARVNALRGVAGTADDLERAISARGAAAQKGYGDAFSAGVDVKMADALQPQIDNLLARPSMQRAMAHAKELAAEGSLNLDEMGSVQGLHYLKMALDDMVQEAAANPTKQRLIRQTADDLKSVLGDIAPAYGKASRTYADMSAPVNRMQVGQTLLERLQPALADHGALARETGASFTNALRGGDTLARKATGFNGATLEGVMGPQGMSTLNSVAADLARKANAQELGRGVGSNTFQNFAMDNVAQQSGIPRAVGGLLDLPLISRGVAWTYRTTDQKVRDSLADALLSPQKAAALMSQADKRWLADNPGVRRALEQAAVRPGGLLGGLVAAPAVAEQ